MSDWRSRLAQASKTAWKMAWPFLRHKVYPVIVTLVRILLVFLGWAAAKLWSWCRGTLFPAIRSVYLRTPPKRRLIAIALIVVIVVTATLFAPGVITNRSASTESEEPLSEYEASVAATLANRLFAAESYKDASSGVRDVLALAGISTVSGKGKPSQAAAPAASFTVLVPEAANLALEARHRPEAGRLTLTEFADMLEGLGFPFEHEVMDAAEQLQAFLSGWVSAARTRPDDPTSFVPLFLAESAKSQHPSVDLTGDYEPDQLRLSMLDMQLFFSAFDRAMQSGQPGNETAFVLGINTAHAAEPCTDVKNWLGQTFGDKGKVAGEILQAALGEGTGFGMKEAFLSAGFKELGADQLSKMITSIGIANKLLKLATLYSQVQLDITVDSENPLQKHLESEEPKFTAFTAHAGVSDADWERYKKDISSSDIVRSLRDCFNIAGLPVLNDVGDLGKDAANWTVEWRLVEGGEEHGTISLQNNKFLLPGQLEMQLQQEDDHKASATLVVDLTPDKAKDRSGPEKTARVTAQASLDTSSAPGLGTLINTVKGGMGDVLGITDAIVELAAGMIQSIATPKAYGTLEVIYHDDPKGNWVGTISYEYEYSLAEDTADGTSQTSSAYSATINITGTKRRAVTALEDLNWLTGTATADYTMDTTSHAVIETEFLCLTETFDTSIKGSGSMSEPYEATLNISVATNGNGGYSISARPPDVPYEQTNKSTVVRVRTCGTPQPNSEDEFTDQLDFSVPIESLLVLSGKIDPSNPHEIQGSKTVTEDNGTGTAKWNLKWVPDDSDESEKE
ncbi:hypothetical protein [Cohnella candidum]|uniref:Uncharacterized protein n=1 Tax=Cohnella candidum TaxID=2674991 RepID=A0A3G3K3N8_9BACL|nr:hypothetical protein [Cohnella candidum]AYQ74771.1 hypothetical protein EAV92_20785 [Cohnella candidum]